MIKIFLVEDHSVVRNGIKLLLDTQANMQVIGEAENGLEALKYLKSGEHPDVIMTDITMDKMDGIQLAEKLRTEFPAIKTIMLTMLNNTQYVLQAFEKGAKGYLVKNVGYDELLFAINHVSAGGNYVCEEIAMLLIERLKEQPMLQNSASKMIEDLELSERELEVLQLIGNGFTNLEISEQLFLSKRTVEGHRQNLIDKTGVKNSAALIKFAVKNGFIN